MSIRIWTAIVAGVCLVTAGSASSAQTRRGQGFDRIDTDKDGKISREEWISYYSARFEANDADGDGFVTEKEMSSARKSRGGNRSRSRNSDSGERED